MPCLRRRILPPPSSSAEAWRLVYRLDGSLTITHFPNLGEKVRTRATNDFDCSGHITSFHSSFQGSGADHCNYSDEIVTTCFQWRYISPCTTQICSSDKVYIPCPISGSASNSALKPNVRPPLPLVYVATNAVSKSLGLLTLNPNFFRAVTRFFRAWLINYYQDRD